MATHRIVRRGEGYRIETTAMTGRHWLLPTMYATEEAALMRLECLNAMATADMPRRETAERQPRENMA